MPKATTHKNTIDTSTILPVNGEQDGIPTHAEPDNQVHDISLDQIIPDPHQPRKHFAIRELEETAASIREHGVLQPILVKPVPVWNQGQPQKHVIIYGERRWRAAALAGLETIPAIVRDIGSRNPKLLQLVENNQRQALSDVEIGTAILELQDEGLSQREIQKSLGYSSLSQVTNRIKLLGCSEPLLQMVADYPGTMSHAIEINKIKDEKTQAALIDETIQHRASVNDIKAQVKKLLGSAGQANGRVYGSPPQHGIKQLPKTSIVGQLETAARALETALDALRGVRVPRSSYKVQWQRVKAAVDEIEELQGKGHRQ